MDDKFLKPYNPAEVEDRIYKMWEDSGYFNPDRLPGDRTEAFTVVLPPPNVTGVLHLGHAYEDSLQDAVIRYQRLRGKKTLWVPGTDSAAIATQARVEKDILKTDGKTRHDLGREELVRRVADFAKSSENTILNQVRKMGASLDWSRYAYTMDDARYTAVMEAFVRMFNAGLIYRGNRIVNWDPKGQTTISDDETQHEERDATLYTFRYSKDFPIAISTTRPETKVGDTAVAVHPTDERYQQYIGQEFDLVFCDVPIHITIVADKSVEPEFGTGALGVTPAHSMIDWEIADRHNLPRPQVINEYAKMMVDGRLKDKKTTEARELVVEWLRTQGLLDQEENVKQNISIAERTGAVIEPLPKLQWWISVTKPFAMPQSDIPGLPTGTTTTLKDMMRQCVVSEAVSMPQERFRKTYFHWINNLRDWCISRQIWFGHRIPVWYKGDDMKVQIDSPGADWTQDPDVLDTWFSSALWTFSTLGWPAESSDLQTFHPTSFMSPAYEILPLWVSRMILMSGFHLGQVPFRTVMIHGLVRDKQGRKFSKSLGTGIDPLDLIAKFGADALRMGLLVGTAIGNDISFDENKVKAYKLFANKLWNVTRFILDNIQNADVTTVPTVITSADQEILNQLETTVADITTDFDNYRLYLAAEKIYHYIWHEIADKILEESKPLLAGTEGAMHQAATLSRQYTLYTLLVTSLKILHPFMPFVTEEIWQSLPSKDGEMLMVAQWPEIK